MEVIARGRYIRISPRKVRLFTRELVGKKVEEADQLLQLAPQKAARILSKILRSAVANAEQREEIDLDSLFVKKILVDGGPVLKRYRARALGRAGRILKRTSHITVVLDEA